MENRKFSLTQVRTVQIETQTFFILTSCSRTAQNYSTCYQLVAAVSGHSLIKVFLCPEPKAQLMNSELPEACTLSNGAHSSFAPCSVQALYHAWSCSARELYPAVGGQPAAATQFSRPTCLDCKGLPDITD